MTSEQAAARFNARRLPTFANATQRDAGSAPAQAADVTRMQSLTSQRRVAADPRFGIRHTAPAAVVVVNTDDDRGTPRNSAKW
ncbi:hypothetical protein [Oricola indica]|uniref:hypothetical protein n=1 Tax=Oricola indica TaxID=2872591 RepID=UPI003CCBB5F1